jgi:6-phosphofructokinase 1
MNQNTSSKKQLRQKAKSRMARIGLMTGGGDAPGLNGIIEASCKTLLQLGHEVVGIKDGFEGIFNRQTITLTTQMLEGAHASAGTLLGTSNRSDTTDREGEFLSGYKSLQLDGLIACGGDGTFSGLKKFEKDIPLIGVPKTIDNDLSGTEITFGFDTACTVVAETVDSLRATAEAHKRVMIVEAMGRTAGWLALGGGLAGYADVILIPERPFDAQALSQFIKQKRAAGKRGLLICVSEAAHEKGASAKVAFHVAGSPQAERYGGISQQLARWVESETDWESRHVVLGHLQRSRFPTTTDRFLTLSMGVEVARMAAEGAWGQAVVYRSGNVMRAPITDLMGPVRVVTSDHRWVKLAQSLGLFI